MDADLPCSWASIVQCCTFDAPDIQALLYAVVKLMVKEFLHGVFLSMLGLRVAVHLRWSYPLSQSAKPDAAAYSADNLQDYNYLP